MATVEEVLRLLAAREQPEPRWPRLVPTKPHAGATYRCFALVLEQSEAAMLPMIAAALKSKLAEHHLQRATAMWVKDYFGEVGPALEDGSLRMVLLLQFTDPIAIPWARSKVSSMLKSLHGSLKTASATTIAAFAGKLEIFTSDLALFVRQAFLRIDSAWDGPHCEEDAWMVRPKPKEDDFDFNSDDEGEPEPKEAIVEATDALAVPTEGGIQAYVAGPVAQHVLEFEGRPLSYKNHFNEPGEGGELEFYVPHRVAAEKVAKLMRVHARLPARIGPHCAAEVMAALEDLENRGVLPTTGQKQRVERALHFATEYNPMTVDSEDYRDLKSALWKVALAKSKPVESVKCTECTRKRRLENAFEGVRGRCSARASAERGTTRRSCALSAGCRGSG